MRRGHARVVNESTDAACARRFIDLDRASSRAEPTGTLILACTGGTRGVHGMDALKKAVLLLWQYNDLLEKEHDDIRKEVAAIGGLVMRYIGEAKIDEKQYPETMAAMRKVVKSLESRASHIESFHQERLKTMHAMQAVFIDLAIDATATRQ